MSNQIENGMSKKQHSLRCLVIPDAIYNKAKLVAHFTQRSVSSLIRELINESFRKNKKKIETGWEEA